MTVDFHERLPARTLNSNEDVVERCDDKAFAPVDSTDISASKPDGPLRIVSRDGL